MEGDARQVVAVLKAQMLEVVRNLIPPGDRPFEHGFRLNQKHDKAELDEAIKLTEYMPVQRGVVKLAKEYAYVSKVWLYGDPWSEGTAAVSAPTQDIPYCPGVTAEQARATASCWKAWSAGSPITATASAFRPWVAKWPSTRATPTTAWSTRCAWASPASASCSRAWRAGPAIPR